jgi:hypothetical protein
MRALSREVTMPDRAQQVPARRASGPGPGWLRLTLTLAAVAAASTAAAQSGPSEEGGWSFELQVLEEYDDNVNFANGSSEPKRDDYVTRVEPKVGYRHPLGQHLFRFDALADYRAGIDTELSDFNANVGTGLDLDFSGGLSGRLLGQYARSVFDLAIFDEPGSTASDAWLGGASFTYQPAERFLLSAGYQYRWQTFDDEVGTGDRSIHDAHGAVDVPLGYELVGYGQGHWRRQDAEDRPDRRYDDWRAVGGLRFVGPRRFTLWAEGGFQEIQYDDSGVRSYDGAVGEAGVGVRLTDSTSSRMAVGYDGYGSFVFTGDLSWTGTDRQSFRFTVDRSTRQSFTVASQSPIFLTTLIEGVAELPLGRKLELTVRGGLFLYDDAGDQPVAESTTGTITLRLLYAIQEWLLIGGHYQYAERVSDSETAEYTDNRGGATIRLRF